MDRDALLINNYGDNYAAAGMTYETQIIPKR